METAHGLNSNLLDGGNGLPSLPVGTSFSAAPINTVPSFNEENYIADWKALSAAVRGRDAYVPDAATPGAETK